jgi:hypothetical protein
MVNLYQYISKAKHDELMRDGVLKPTAPFNPRVSNKDWGGYIKRFRFPVSRFYSCAFFDPKPDFWIEYGLFDLLMEEFAGGEFLLKIITEDNINNPIIVRDHKYHSPKEYGCAPKIWRNRNVRDLRPDLRDKWYESAVLLSNYDGSYICPEVLIPFSIPLHQIRVERI